MAANIARPTDTTGYRLGRATATATHSRQIGPNEQSTERAYSPRNGHQARTAPERTPVPRQHAPPRDRQNPTRHRFHPSPSGRIRRRMLLAPMPRTRIFTKIQRGLVVPKARHQRRTRPENRQPASRGGLDSDTHLGTRRRRHRSRPSRDYRMQHVDSHSRPIGSLPGRPFDLR